MLKAGIVGLGRMGQAHLEAYKELGIQIKWIVDPRVDEIRSQLKQNQSEQHPDVYGTINEISESMKVDIISVATLSVPRIGIAKRIIDNKLCSHLLLEKPVGLDMQENLELLRKADGKSVHLAVNHPTRYMKSFELIKKMGREKLGSLSSMYCTGGAFGLANNGPHIVEIFMWLTGEGPDSVKKLSNIELFVSPRGEDLEDAVGTIMIKTKKGKKCILDTAMSQKHGLHYIYTFEYGVITHNALTGEIVVEGRDESRKDQPMYRYGEANSITKYCEPTESNSEATKSTIMAFLEGENFPTFESSLIASDVLKSVMYGGVKTDIKVNNNEYDFIHNLFSDVTNVCKWA